MWNFLPEYVVNAPGVDSFKNRLDKQWSNEDILYEYKQPYQQDAKSLHRLEHKCDHRGNFKPVVMKIPK